LRISNFIDNLFVFLRNKNNKRERIEDEGEGVIEELAFLIYQKS